MGESIVQAWHRVGALRKQTQKEEAGWNDFPVEGEILSSHHRVFQWSDPSGSEAFHRTLVESTDRPGIVSSHRIAPDEVDRCLASMGGGDSRRDDFDSLFKLVTSFRLEGAHRTAEVYLVGNHVEGITGFHLGDADHRGIKGIGVPGDQ